MGENKKGRILFDNRGVLVVDCSDFYLRMHRDIHKIFRRTTRGLRRIPSKYYTLIILSFFENLSYGKRGRGRHESPLPVKGKAHAVHPDGGRVFAQQPNDNSNIVSAIGHFAVGRAYRHPESVLPLSVYPS